MSALKLLLKGRVTVVCISRHLSSRLNISPNEFGNLHPSDVPLERVARSPRSLGSLKQKEPRGVKSITLPVGLSSRQVDRLREKQNEFDERRTNTRTLIECSKREFNHQEGRVYPRGERIPLCSEFWLKNKYKDHWFTIKRKLKAAPSNTADPLRMDTGWDQFLPDKLDPTVVASLRRMGLNNPLGVQAQCILSFTSPQHLFLAAETGSGKTIAFAAPLISKLLRDRRPSHRETTRSRGVIMVATGGLKQQTFSVVSDLALGTGIKVKLCEQTSSSAEPSSSSSTSNDWDILIGTPGLVERDLRLLDDGTEVKHMILDEADMLLDNSFTETLTEIFSIIPVAHSETNLRSGARDQGARLLFCSASCPEDLECLAEAVVDRTSLSYVRSHRLHSLMNNVEMKFIRIREMDKLKRLTHLLDLDQRKGDQNQTLVFCKDRKTAQFVHSEISSADRSALLWGGEMKPADLEATRVIVATDVAARGIDLPRLSHVINYDMARHSVDFLHRSGRVGRLSSVFPGRMTSFIRTASEVALTNTIELAARLGRPLTTIETDVAGILSRRQQTEEDHDED